MQPVAHLAGEVRSTTASDQRGQLTAVTVFCGRIVPLVLPSRRWRRSRDLPAGLGSVAVSRPLRCRDQCLLRLLRDVFGLVGSLSSLLRQQWRDGSVHLSSSVMERDAVDALESGLASESSGQPDLLVENRWR